ncbi:MAG: DUF177 domain-containing protein [Alphaproteobacteria bacterium]|nr:DUF177 domain-containing protein [Alphaproteobacteria bacterium]
MTAESPFSFEVPVDSLPHGGAAFEVEADPATRRAVANRLDVPAIDRLIGRFHLAPTREGARLKGALEARLVRHCVASLEPVEESVSEEFEIAFFLQENGETEVDFDPDAPEPLETGVVDLAEILVQQLSLAMDPYPRRPDAPPLGDTAGSDRTASPFEALREAFAGQRDKR